MDDVIRYTHKSAVFGTQEIAADSRVGFIEFTDYNNLMEQFLGTLVPWHLAIEFLRLHSNASADKVWWRDSLGRIGHSGWSNIKVVRDDWRLYQLHTLAGHPILVETAIERDIWVNGHS